MDTKASTLDPTLLQLVVEMILFGTAYSWNAVAPIMKEQRAGKIITVSSVAGIAPAVESDYAHNGPAKAAIAHYTRYLAPDLGRSGHGELHRPWRNRHRADHGDGYSRQHSGQP